MLTEDIEATPMSIICAEHDRCFLVYMYISSSYYCLLLTLLRVGGVRFRENQMTIFRCIQSLIIRKLKRHVNMNLAIQYLCNLYGPLCVNYFSATAY